MLNRGRAQQHNAQKKRRKKRKRNPRIRTSSGADFLSITSEYPRNTQKLNKKIHIRGVLEDKVLVKWPLDGEAAVYQTTGASEWVSAESTGPGSGPGSGSGSGPGSGPGPGSGFKETADQRGRCGGLKKDKETDSHSHPGITTFNTITIYIFLCKYIKTINIFYSPLRKWWNIRKIYYYDYHMSY